MYPYRNSKQTRELTTDQGLPVDAAQSVPAGRYSGEQPVYRSVELGAPLSVLPQSLSQVEPRSGFIDFVLPAKAQLKAPALVVEPAAELQLPHVDSIFEPLSTTRFEVSMAPAALLSQLQSLFEENAVSILSFESANEIRCEKYCEKAVASAIFHVRLLSNGPGKVIVEFQCRSGCRSAFSNIYRLAKSQWHQCAPRRSLNALPLPKATTSTTTSPEQWDSLLAWMQNDPSEALRAATCLASTGATVCDGVMSQFVAHLADHRVDALEAITASIPSHRLQGYEDAIFSAVSEALSGSQIEERTACKLVAKVAAQLPELLSRDSCNFTSKLATAATASKWPCTREFAQTTLSILQPSAAVY